MHIEIDISDRDVVCLENDLLDVAEWVRLAIEGKINSCKKRLIKPTGDNILELRADPELAQIPNNESELIDLIVSRSWYRNRQRRDDDAQAEHEARLKELNDKRIENQER